MECETIDKYLAASLTEMLCQCKLNSTEKNILNQTDTKNSQLNCQGRDMLI